MDYALCEKRLREGLYYSLSVYLIWLVRTLFIIPGAFWLIGLIVYLVLALSLEEWPPSEKRLVHEASDDQPRDFERLIRNDQNWNRFGKFYLIGLAACLISVPVSALSGADALAQILLYLFFICLLAVIPLGVVASIARYKANKAKILRTWRVDFEKQANRLCTRCHKSLPPTASVCSALRRFREVPRVCFPEVTHLWCNEACN